LNAFLRDPVVVTPADALAQRPEHAHRQIAAGQAPETLVLAHAPRLRDALVAATGAARAPFDVAAAELHLAGGVGVCWPGVGGPAAALVLEKCIAAGTRRVVSVGFGGGLVPGTRAGDVCLALEAVPDDGVTPHYLAPGHRPQADGRESAALAAALAPERRGTVWSTAAPYRETRDAVAAHRASGVLAVDMETAAVLAVAAYRGVPASAVLVITDVLGDAGWRPCAPGAVDGVVARVAKGIAQHARARS